MKNNRGKCFHNLIRVGTLVSATVYCASLSSCFGISMGKRAFSLNADSGSTAAQSVFAPGATAGIKNQIQLGFSVATVTNMPIMSPMYDNSAAAAAAAGQIPQGTPVLNDSYQVIAPWLSADGSAASMNSSMLIAITQYVASACKAMLISDALKPDGSRWADNGINFTAGPLGLVSNRQSATALVRLGSGSPADPGAQAIEQYTSKFWRRAATTQEFQAFSTALIAAINDSSGISSNVSATDQTIDVLIVPCTMALTSPAFLAN